MNDEIEDTREEEDVIDYDALYQQRLEAADYYYEIDGDR